MNKIYIIITYTVHCKMNNTIFLLPWTGFYFFFGRSFAFKTILLSYFYCTKLTEPLNA